MKWRNNRKWLRASLILEYQWQRSQNVPHQGPKTSQLRAGSLPSKTRNYTNLALVFILKIMRNYAGRTKLCEIVRKMLNYAKLCGKCKIVRKCAENRKLCDSALTALKSCLWYLAISLETATQSGEKYIHKNRQAPTYNVMLVVEWHSICKTKDHANIKSQSLVSRACTRSTQLKYIQPIRPGVHSSNLRIPVELERQTDIKLIKKNIHPIFYWYSKLLYSVVTLLAKFLGQSTSRPLSVARWNDKSWSGITARMFIRQSTVFGREIDR